MKQHSAVQRALAIVVAGACVGSPSALLASGFQLVEQNASGLGNAYAGQAAGVKDASAIYYNPANLTRVPGKQFVVGISPIGVKTEFNNSGSTRPYLPTSPVVTPIPVPLGSAGGDAGGWIPLPNGYFSWQAGSKWWVGLGVNAPFGLKTEWDSDFMGRFKAVKSEVQTININPTVALKVTDQFSLGAGASYQRLKATLSQSVAYGGITLGAAGQAAAAARNPFIIPAMLAQIGGLQGLALEGVSQVEGDTWTWGWNAGAALRIGEEGHLAASYRSAIKHTIHGNVAFAGAPTFVTTGPVGQLGALLNSRFAAGPVNAAIELPQTVSVAASYEKKEFEVLADWTWTGWSSIQNLAINRADGSALSSVPLTFKDTWRAGLGFNYRLNDAWTLRLGTAYDKSPVQDVYRTPRLPDQDRAWAAAGFQWRIGKSGAVDLGYAHLFVKDASSNLPNQDSPTSAPGGKLVGTYKESVNILSVQYRHSF